MPASKSKTIARNTGADSTDAVDEFMRTLTHPFKDEIEAIRASILGVDHKIAEGIKWNAPSFRTREYFATINLREKKGIGLILHLGAKVRDLPADGVAIDDAAKLLKWLGKDRAMIVFENRKDFNSKKTAFTKTIRQWIHYV